MHKKGNGICALIVLLLLCPQALAIEATPASWKVYQTLETGAEKVEVLVDYTRYEDVRLCVINVDEGSFLPELAERMNLLWDAEKRIAVVSWDTRSTELTFLYRPDPQKTGDTAVTGELVFSCYNADGERIYHDRVRIVRTDAGLRLSIKPVEEAPQTAPRPSAQIIQEAPAPTVRP